MLGFSTDQERTYLKILILVIKFQIENIISDLKSNTDRRAVFCRLAQAPYEHKNADGPKKKQHYYGDDP